MVEAAHLSSSLTILYFGPRPAEQVTDVSGWRRLVPSLQSTSDEGFHRL